jgi:hypothetical protein
MTLSKDKQGEIALAILKFKFKKDGRIPDATEMKRNIGNVSRETGFSKEELKDFSILLVKELAGEFISKMEKIDK